MAKFQRASAEAVAKAEKSLSFELVVPKEAKRNRKDSRDARWKEEFVINEVTSEFTTSAKGDEHLLLIVGGTIVSGAVPSDNDGRALAFKGRLNYEEYDRAVKNGDEKNKQYRMHMITMANLSQLLRAVGMYDGGDIEAELLEQAFPDEGLSPMVGQRITVEVHQKPNDDGRIFPEISGFLVPDGAGGFSAAEVGEELSL